MKLLKKYLLPILIFVALIILITFSPRDKATLSQGNVSIDDTAKSCYLYEQQYQSSIDGESDVVTFYDREYIELGFGADSMVSGIHNILPAEKDSNRANFVGVSDGEYVNVVATARAEGQTWQEQRLYRLVDDKLYIGYQPVYIPQYKNENDIYMYEDLNKIIFDTDTFFLNKIDCASVSRKDVS